MVGFRSYNLAQNLPQQLVQGHETIMLKYGVFGLYAILFEVTLCLWKYVNIFGSNFAGRTKITISFYMVSKFDLCNPSTRSYKSLDADSQDKKNILIMKNRSPLKGALGGECYSL